MTIANPLRYCLSGDTEEVVDRILGPFLQECMGKNDMAVTNGLLCSAAILIAAHCQRTGEDFEELAELCRQSFNSALNVSSEQVP
jgi:hypothetical protein